MTYPFFPVKDGRVYNPKHIVNLRMTTWLEWQLSTLGARNYTQKGTPGDGWEDTNDKESEVPSLLDDGSINPEKDRKQMCGGVGNQVYNVVGTITQGGTKYDILQTLDYYNQPVEVEGTFYVDGRAISWETHPHLFTSRENVKRVKPENRTWISRRGVQAVSDGGLIGNKMKEWWANPSKTPVSQPRYLLRRFPTLPARLHLYGNSLIVDGELVTQYGGKTMTVDAYIFSGSKVFVREQESRYWYLAHEMLVRASLLSGWYATALDYRCYATLETNGQSLYMGDRVQGIPDPGIFRKDMDFWFYVREAVKAYRNL